MIDVIDVFFQFFIILFSAYGLYSIIFNSIKYFEKPWFNNNIKLVIFVKDNQDYIEKFLITILPIVNANILIVDMDSKDDTYKILNLMQRKNHSFKVCKKDNFLEYYKYF